MIKQFMIWGQFDSTLYVYDTWIIEKVIIEKAY